MFLKRRFLKFDCQTYMKKTTLYLRLFLKRRLSWIYSYCFPEMCQQWDVSSPGINPDPNIYYILCSMFFNRSGCWIGMADMGCIHKFRMLLHTRAPAWNCDGLGVALRRCGTFFPPFLISYCNSQSCGWSVVWFRPNIFIQDILNSSNKVLIASRPYVEWT